jgi:hypothetical protein
VPKFLILAVLVTAAVFAAVSMASTGSGSTIQVQLPGEAKMVDGHPMPTAQAEALAVNASATSSRFGLRYLFADVNLGPGKTKGRAIRCPRRWHPVSGLFFADSKRVVTLSDAPTSKRTWAVFVRNEGNTQTGATVGAVCEKGVPIR